MKRTLVTSALLCVLATTLGHAQLASTVNDNGTTPAAPAGALNVIPANDGGRPTVNVAHYVVYPTFQAACQSASDLTAAINSALSVAASKGGLIIDARTCGAATTWNTPPVITVSNVTILLPCQTITMGARLSIGAGTHNVAIEGCSYEGGKAGSACSGGTVLYNNTPDIAIAIGDNGYSVDTTGFTMKNLSLCDPANGYSANTLQFYRTQEIRLENLVLSGWGNAGQTGIALDGTGNYTGGRFDNVKIQGYTTAISLYGHMSGSVIDDYANASTFTKMHIDCPATTVSLPDSTAGVNLVGGDGNTFNGIDVEGCTNTIILGPNATSNTFVGIRYESTTSGVLAMQGSNYNSLFFGTTIYTGTIADSGSRNSFFDAFHRTFNGVNGDWRASQNDGTLTDHNRVGTGLGNERGALSELQTDYGYRWLQGYSDGTSGAQFWYLQDLVNNVYRVQAGQFLAACGQCVTNVIVNNSGVYTSSAAPTLAFSGGGGTSAAATANMVEIGTSGSYQIGTVTITNQGTGYTSAPSVTVSGGSQTSAPSLVAEITPAGGTNNQTVINAAGTGAVVLNGSNNAGTGGVVFGSGGSTESTVGQIDNTGNAYLWGDVYFTGASGTQWALEGNSTSSFTIQNSGGSPPARILKAFQSAGTDIDSQNSSAVTFNNTASGGTGGLLIYGGGSNYYNSLLFGVTQSSGAGVYHFPSLAASSGHNCLQVDTSGYMTSTGTPCITSAGLGTVTSVGVAAPSDFTVSGSPVSTSGTLTLAWSGTASGSAPTWNQNTSGTAANVTATSNSTLATLSALSLPYSQLSGTVPTWNQNTTGTAANVTATSNATLATLSALSLPYSQLSGTVPTWNQNTTGTAAALTGTPTLCTAGYAPTGILASGAATGCAPLGTATWGTGNTYLTGGSTTQFVAQSSAEGGSQNNPFVAPRAGKMQNCTAVENEANSGTVYYTATLWKNAGACSSGPIIVLNGASNTPVSDNSDTCTVAQGDRLSWQFVPTGSPTGPIVSVSCLY